MKSYLKIIKYIVLFTLFVAVCFILGLFLGGLVKGKSLAETLNGMSNTSLLDSVGVILLSILSMFIGGGLQVIVHELGHLVFGLASGYKFLSFQVLGFAVVQEDKKINIKRFNLAGAAGQCLMLPPDRNAEEVAVVAYNAGGFLFNLLLTSILALLLFFGNPSSWVAVFLTITVFIGIYMIILNGIPMILSGGLPNDGHNISRLRRNRKSKEAFLELLRLSALIKEGTRPKDFPSSCFKDFEEVDFKEPLQVNLYSAYASYLLDRGDYDKCESVCREIIEKEKRVMLFILEAKCELACLLFMKGCNEEAKSLLDKKELKIVKGMSKTMSSKKRFLFFSSLYGEGDITTAESIYQGVLDNKDNYLIKGETVMDIHLMQSALESTT